MPIFAEQNMSAFAIRVVDDRIKHGDAFHFFAVRIAHRKEMLAVNEIDKHLHDADTFWSIAQNRWRHIRPAKRRTQSVRRDLTFG